MPHQMTGAKMVVQALKDQGVDTIFGYPGGAVLPIYDEIFLQNDIRHINRCFELLPEIPDEAPLSRSRG